MSDIKEWTLMFYFASDNPLAPSIVSQLKAIKEAGFHADANVIARFDPHPLNTPAHIFEVNLINKLKARGKSRVGFTANDPFVRTLVSDKLWRDKDIIEKIRKALNKPEQANGNARSSLDALDPDEESRDRSISEGEIIYAPAMPTEEMSSEQPPKESLETFLQFCKKEYEARHYMLFILGHGVVVGNDLFLFDEHTSQQPDDEDAAKHSLLLQDLREVLAEFNKSTDSSSPKNKLDLLGFHSCSMSALEVAYELRDEARYLLASQGPAFVGSWPYRQLLIRVFNDLEAPSFRFQDLIDAPSFLNKLKTAADPLSTYLLEKFTPRTRAMVGQFVSGTAPGPELVSALIDELNTELADPYLHESSRFQTVELSEETKTRLSAQPKGLDLKWLNRRLLEDAFPELKKTRKRQTTLKEMLVRMLYYCLYNSFDFQLAGYSYDLCLSDLEKLGAGIEAPVQALSEKLMAGVSDTVARKLILLAHWEAQSYWQENYTDLYDFCYCLERLCVPKPTSGAESEMIPVQPISAIIGEIGAACSSVMKVLRRGGRDDDDTIVIRSEYAGPAYQYSHGFSVFFPWSQPRDSFFWNTVDSKTRDGKPRTEATGYKSYQFAKKTNWSKFLDDYFTKTMRLAHSEEGDVLEPTVVNPNLDRELLDEITEVIFNEQGQLKVGPRDVTGKDGPHDPAGGDCECTPIKNYPPFTRARASRNFFIQFDFE